MTAGHRVGPRDAPPRGPTVAAGNAVPVIDARGLRKTFEQTVAVDGIDLVVDSGEIHGLVGPNGAGKTTVLGILFGLIEPDGGSMRLFGRSRTDSGQTVLDGVAGFIENPRFYPYLSGRRNLMLLAELDGGASRQRIDEVLELSGLDGSNRSRVGAYSLGMRQRLGVAAALLRDPRLLILDEPANGLDPAGMRDLREMIRRLARRGLTVLLASHDMGEVEDLCDRVTVMRSGSAVFRGSVPDLRAQAPDPVYGLRTSDDTRAVRLALGVPGVTADPDPGGGLTVRAQQERLDAYAIALGKADIAVRALDLTERPLEALFFRLTESGPEPAVRPVPEVVR